jgi:protein-S-isoprenylcysteine O-methyltransferase Ste14
MIAGKNWVIESILIRPKMDQNLRFSGEGRMNQNQGDLSTQKINRAGINRAGQVGGYILAIAVILFLSAGRLTWLEAWAYLFICLLNVSFNAFYMLRHDPGLINERGKAGENAKSWDKVIGMIYTFLQMATFLVAGLDFRFGWSKVPLILEIVGGLGFALAMAFVSWVMTANPFLSTIVRIQDDRGHYTVTSGPYRFVRHPMYSGLFFSFLATALLLGSWWALVPAVLDCILFIVRTTLEDKSLQNELPGYRDYAQKVRNRLIPGIW